MTQMSLFDETPGEMIPENGIPSLVDFWVLSSVVQLVMRLDG